MGELIQFRPRNAAAVEIANVVKLGDVPAGALVVAAQVEGHGVTLFYEVERGQDDDTAPSEMNPG